MIRTDDVSPAAGRCVHLRTRTPQSNIRRTFLDYIRAMNDMRVHPRFYNTLTTNCTTTILMHTRINPESPPMSWESFAERLST